MSSDLQFSAPRLFCLWPTGAPHWKSTSFKMCFLPQENFNSYKFGWTFFHKTPPWAFQSAPFPKKSVFRGVPGSSWHWHRLRRLDMALTPQRLTFKSALSTSQIDFLPIFETNLIQGQDLLRIWRKPMAFSIYNLFLPFLDQTSSLFVCSRHRFVGLHFGHFILCAGVHPWRFIQFRRMKFLKVAAAAGKVMFFSTLWHFSVITSWLSLSRPRFLPSFCSAF